MSSGRARAKEEQENGKPNAKLLASMDVGNDFELVHHQEEKGGQKLVKPDQNEEQEKAHEYNNLVQKMKNEMKPLKKELLHDQETLKKLKSNLVDESKTKNDKHQQQEQQQQHEQVGGDNKNNNTKNTTKNNTNANENTTNDKNNTNSKNESETTTSKNDDSSTITGDGGNDLKFKISSMKYDLMKKDRQIDELQNKIKSFGQKMDSYASDSKLKPDDVNYIILLKKELELVQDDTENNNVDNNNRVIQNLDVTLKDGQILELFIGSCFHVVNAVLIVILLSVYYSRDKYTEKRITALVILAAYVVTNFISLYLTRLYTKQSDEAKVYTGRKEYAKTLIPRVILLGCCLTACILLVCQVAKRYEDAATFVKNMLYLMGFCSAINFVLVLIVSKWTAKKSSHNSNEKID